MIRGFAGRGCFAVTFGARASPVARPRRRDWTVATTSPFTTPRPRIRAACIAARRVLGGPPAWASKVDLLRDRPPVYAPRSRRWPRSPSPRSPTSSTSATTSAVRHAGGADRPRLPVPRQHVARRRRRGAWRRGGGRRRAAGACTRITEGHTAAVVRAWPTRSPTSPCSPCSWRSAPSSASAATTLLLLAAAITANLVGDIVYLDLATQGITSRAAARPHRLAAMSHGPGGHTAPRRRAPARSRHPRGGGSRRPAGLQRRQPGRLGLDGGTVQPRRRLAGVGCVLAASPAPRSRSRRSAPSTRSRSRPAPTTSPGCPTGAPCSRRPRRARDGVRPAAALSARPRRLQGGQRQPGPPRR